MTRDNNNRLYLVLLAGLGVLQFFVLLGHGSLWDIDEGMHAVIAQNMIATGDWVTPVFNGAAFLDKPALCNWLVAGSFGIFGYTEFAARVPSALAAFGCIFLVYSMGRQACDSETGLLAAIVLATSLMFAIVARIVIYDLPFVFFTTLAMYIFCMALLREEWRDGHFVGFYVACGLAVLAKGPIGFALPAAIIGVFVLVQRRWSLLRELHMPLGLLVFLAVVSPWYVLMEHAHPGYLEYFIIKQHFANFLGSSGSFTARHPEPWFFYLPYLLAGMFPWTVFLPQSLYRAARVPRGWHREFSRLCLAWVAVVLLVFSVASSKLPTYILPMFPAAALLIGRYCRDLLQAGESDSRRGARLGLALASGLLLAGLVYVLVADPWAPLGQKYGLEPVELTVAVAGVAMLLAGAWLSSLARRGSLTMAALAGVSPFLVLFLTWSVVPDVQPYRSSRDIGVAYDRMLPAGEKMVFCGQLFDSAMFYTGREALLLYDRSALDKYLSAGVPAIVNLTSNECAGVLHDALNSVTVLGDKAIVARARQPTPTHSSAAP